jgi:hypothetical protein
MKHLTSLIVLSLLAMAPAITSADVLTVAPEQAVILPADGSGLTRVALLFDLSDMRTGIGRQVNMAHLDWSISGVSASTRSAFSLHEITESWTEAQVQVSQSLEHSEAAVAEWDIEPMDHARVGGFVRFDLKSLVTKWCTTPATNFGVVVATDDLSSETLAGQLGNARLVVRYAFYRLTQ